MINSILQGSGSSDFNRLELTKNAICVGTKSVLEFPIIHSFHLNANNYIQKESRYYTLSIRIILFRHILLINLHAKILTLIATRLNNIIIIQQRYKPVITGYKPVINRSKPV